MKRKILVECFCVIFILVLVSCTSVVNAQTIKSNEIRTNVFQQLKDKLDYRDWYPGFLLDLMLLILLMIFGPLFGSIQLNDK